MRTLRTWAALAQIPGVIFSPFPCLCDRFAHTCPLVAKNSHVVVIPSPIVPRGLRHPPAQVMRGRVRWSVDHEGAIESGWQRIQEEKQRHKHNTYTQIALLNLSFPVCNSLLFDIARSK